MSLCPSHPGEGRRNQRGKLGLTLTALESDVLDDVSAQSSAQDPCYLLNLWGFVALEPKRVNCPLRKRRRVSCLLTVLVLGGPLSSLCAIGLE